MKADKKALLAGASGVVGRRLAEYLHSLDDWTVIGLSLGGNDVPRADVDLSDRRDVQAKLGTQSDVTHIFYEARFDHVEGTPEPIDTNVAMFRNLIDTVVPIATNLEHVHTGSGHKNYGLHKGPARTPAREDAPLPGHYPQHDHRALIRRRAAHDLCGDPKGAGPAVQFSRYRRELLCAVSMYGGAAAREGDSLDGDRVRVRQSRFQHHQRGFIPVVEPLA